MTTVRIQSCTTAQADTRLRRIVSILRSERDHLAFAIHCGTLRSLAWVEALQQETPIDLRCFDEVGRTRQLPS